jgi:hypothetical protein
MPDMLYADVHALFYVAIANDLVDNDSNGMRGDIVHNSGPSLTHIRMSGYLRGGMGTDPW